MLFESAFFLFALDYSEAHETWQYKYNTKCKIQEHKNKRNQTGFAAILEQKHYVSCNFLNVLSYCFQMSFIVSHISLFTWKFGKYVVLTAHEGVLLSVWYRICKTFWISSIKQTSPNLNNCSLRQNLKLTISLKWPASITIV